MCMMIPPNFVIQHRIVVNIKSLPNNPFPIARWNYLANLWNRIYDLFNLMTEMATHQLKPVASRIMLGAFGTMISYDLENSCDKYGTFEKFIQPELKRSLDI